MLYVVCYDIEDDRQRNGIAHILEGFGQRVQKSVFECHLNPTQLKQLIRRLEKCFVNEGQNTIRIYPLCRDCRGQVLGIGQMVESQSEKAAYIHL